MIHRHTLFSSILFALSFSYSCLGANAPTPSAKQTWCIVGGTRGPGYALAQNLCNDSSVNCTLFVRDAYKARSLFKNTQNRPTIIEGDVTTDTDALTQAATGATYLVVAQSFPYAVWKESYEAMVTHCITAARSTGATLIYFGRIQRYGLINPITEDSTPVPNCEQGKVLNDLETLLETCGVPTYIICHSYPFGPNVGDGLLETNFTELAPAGSKKTFDWIASDTVPLQFTFLPDLAAFTRQCVAAIPLTTNPCFRINFAGITVPSINDFGKAYCDIAQSKYKISLLSKTKLTIGAAFRPEAKRAKDAFYSFDNEILLSSTLQQQVCPFNLTSLNDALTITHAYYATLSH